jgi:hypothetical protein
VAEYDDPEEDHQHNRTASKFQWQNVLSTVADVTSSGGDDMNVGSSRQLSRCYSARTRVVRRSLNPVFNEEFRFEVADDTLLQVSSVHAVCILFVLTQITYSMMGLISCKQRMSHSNSK